jgi:hypothetical protein
LILLVSGSFLNLGVRSPYRQSDLTQPRLSRPKI